jgi:hypothetical protein
MARERLSTKALYVERGYGQVEPNHLSAQRTGQIYAQLPAAADLAVLENGQFVKYDYAHEVVNTTGAGEWMLVFNEIKLYHDYEADCDFAMIAKNYNGRVYSPVDADSRVTGNSRNYGDIALTSAYTPDSTNNPFVVETFTGPKAMPTGSTMVPRVFKTNIGDIFTTNTVKDETLKVGDVLGIDTDGYLLKDATSDMKWEVVKVYTMPDRQKGVKIMRIA